jgi:hypothetical protein
MTETTNQVIFPRRQLRWCGKDKASGGKEGSGESGEQHYRAMVVDE